jgi:hypothetical protein
MPRDPDDIGLDEAAAAFLASHRTAEVRPSLLARTSEHLRSLAAVGVLIGYGAWCFAAGRLAGLLGSAGSFWHDLTAIALIMAPVFASIWWAARRQKGSVWEALGFWAGLSLFVAFAISM